MNLILCLFILSNLILNVFCLNGSNVCTEEKSVPVHVTIKHYVPYEISTYSFCIRYPDFKCKVTRTAFRTEYRNEVKNMIHKENVCCKGYTETNNRCIPLCNNMCLYGECVAPNKCRCHLGWTGPSCNKCNCPKNFECDHFGSKGCICKYGYEGFNCEKKIPEPIIIITDKSKSCEKDEPTTTGTTTTSADTTIIVIDEMDLSDLNNEIAAQSLRDYYLKNFNIENYALIVFGLCVLLMGLSIGVCTLIKYKKSRIRVKKMQKDSLRKNGLDCDDLVDRYGNHLSQCDNEVEDKKDPNQQIYEEVKKKATAHLDQSPLMKHSKLIRHLRVYLDGRTKNDANIQMDQL